MPEYPTSDPIWTPDSSLRYNDNNLGELLRRVNTDDGRPQVLPRNIVYASPQAERMGLVPLLDYPDNLVEVKDFKEVIQHCRDKKIFPVFHQQNHGLLEYWNQNGLPYCWAWSAVASLMDERAIEGLPPELLAPNSIGWLVNWRRVGYYLAQTIGGIRTRGVASAKFVPDFFNLNPRSFKEGWENDALNYRIKEVWDTRRTSEIYMLRQILTILRTGHPGYVAYNWWSHALEIVGMLWDESERNNVVIQLRNSHKEKNVIELAGSRAVPDEFYGFRAGSLPA